MKLACLFGPLCLSFRGSFAFDQLRSDPRGLTGSELGFTRIAQELKRRGHDVHLFTVSEQTEWDGMRVRPWSESGQDEYDAAIAINEPDLLRGAKARLRVCESWLNDWTFAKPDFDQHVDLFVSPSESHRQRCLTDPEWRHVNVTPSTPRGTFVLEPDPSRWIAIELGCDPERYEPPCDFCGVSPSDAKSPLCSEIHQPHKWPSRKAPGRVIHSSSPDRGLHLLLEAWPAIKRAVPHAHLRIFYRLEPWLRGFDQTPYFAPIEGLRHRAIYVEEALRRMSGPEWGIELCDSVSRERIEREMSEAEVMAYPCDPVNSYTEGFSCSTLEGCAARACPVISDADALGSLYGGHCPVIPRGNWTEWRDTVIRALTDSEWREGWNDKAEAFARQHTWARHAERLEAAISERLTAVTEQKFFEATRLEGSP